MSSRDRLGIEIDPDGLLEEKSSSVVSKKLTVPSKVGSKDTTLTLPTLMTTTNNLSILPVITVFDVL